MFEKSPFRVGWLGRRGDDAHQHCAEVQGYYCSCGRRDPQWQAHLEQKDVSMVHLALDEAADVLYARVEGAPKLFPVGATEGR
jgi:hypothetical protein